MPLPVQDGDRDFGRPGSILLEKGADRPGSVLLEKGADRPGVYLVYAEVGRAVLHMSCHPVSLSLSSLPPLSLWVSVSVVSVSVFSVVSVSVFAVSLFPSLCLSLSLSLFETV